MLLFLVLTAHTKSFSSDKQRFGIAEITPSCANGCRTNSSADAKMTILLAVNIFKNAPETSCSLFESSDHFAHPNLERVVRPSSYVLSSVGIKYSDSIDNSVYPHHVKAHPSAPRADQCEALGLVYVKNEEVTCYACHAVLRADDHQNQGMTTSIEAKCRTERSSAIVSPLSIMMANQQLRSMQTRCTSDGVERTGKTHIKVLFKMEQILEDLPISDRGARLYEFIFMNRTLETVHWRYKESLDHQQDLTDPRCRLISPKVTNGPSASPKEDLQHGQVQSRAGSDPTY
nr:hypothetical protein CFP56_71911 [Quercus suber]